MGKSVCLSLYLFIYLFVKYSFFFFSEKGEKLLFFQLDTLRKERPVQMMEKPLR